MVGRNRNKGTHIMRSHNNNIIIVRRLNPHP
jgi:hypothetical protein